jgi:hypothetical protein
MSGFWWYINGNTDINLESRCIYAITSVLIQKKIFFNLSEIYMAEKGFGLKQCVHTCTDGALSTVGKHMVLLHTLDLHQNEWVKGKR